MRPWGVYIGALFVLLASFVSADPEGWSNDTRLTFNGADSLFPAVATDIRGDIHIVWHDLRSGTPNIFYTKLGHSGQTVVDDLQLTFSGQAERPLIASDLFGNVHVIWIGRSSGQIFYTKLDNNGRTLIDDLQLPAGTDPVHVSFTLDFDGNVHVVGKPISPDEVFYAKLNNNGTILIARMLVPVSARPVIAADHDGMIHMVAESGEVNQRDIYYTKINNNGTILIPNSRITSSNGDSGYPAIATDSQNNVHVVWRDFRDGNFEIYYTKLNNNGVTIIDDLRLTANNADSFTPSIAVDSLDNVHVTWVDFRDGNPEIYYEKLNGTTGTALIHNLQLTSDLMNSVDPKIAIRILQHPQIVWTDNRDGNSEIYFKGDVNAVPLLQEIGNQQINESQTLMVQLNASDPENDTLTFSTNAASVLPSAFSFNETTGLFEWVPTFRDAGNYTVTFTVSDGGSTVRETITITVHDVPLVLQTIGNREINENQTLVIQLEALQPGNAGFIYGTDAAFILPSLFSFNETAGLFVWMPTFRDSGDYAVTFNVTNGYDVANETITVTVNNVNLAPEIQPIPDINIVEGEMLNLRVNASDFDGDRLTYGTNAASILPSRFYFNETTGELTWSTGYTDYGNYTVTFTASDGQLTSARDALIFVRDAQISNLVMVGAPRIGNTVQLLLADRTAINQPYILLMSTSTEQPLALGDGRHVGLTPNTVLLVSLNLPTLIGLRESVGIFNAAGNAIATWTVPNAPELVNTTVHLAFVSLDTVQPGARAIISISPTINTTVIS